MSNYVILQGVAVFPAQILLAGPLLLTWFLRVASWTRNTPRQTSDSYYPSVLTCINYGIIYPVPILIFVIGLTYAPIAPIILPFCALFYAIGYFVNKYMIMYVHIPRYESRGNASIFVVNRCLFGLGVMQLTMMGVLALRAGEGATLVSDTQVWSGYAQMVIGVAPLLLITIFVYGLLNQGFQKQITNIPLELVSNVARDLGGSRSFLVGSALVEAKKGTGLELSEMTGAGTLRDNESQNETSKFFSRVQGTPVSKPLKPRKLRTNSNTSSPFSSVDDERVSTSDRGLSSMDLLESFNDMEPSPFPSPNSHFEEEQPLLGISNESEDFLSLGNHLEPPMTRVPGILDAPLTTSILKLGELDLKPSNRDIILNDNDDDYEDLQINTYLHPALIGTHI